MPQFEVLSRRRVYDGWAKLDELEIRTDAQPSQKRLIVEAGDAAAVVLHNAETDKLLFVRQLRVPLERHGDTNPLEIVAGKVDDRESAADAALREVEEEVGHRLESLEPVREMYPSAGILSEKVSIFYGRISEQTNISGGGGDSTEELEFVELSPSEAFRRLDAGEIRDAKTIIGLMWLRRRLEIA
ncbi:MAG: NUDIX domain-containing protein [Fimbriimonas sp.]